MAKEIIRKRVTLHPLREDGTTDTSINLYPKTFIDGIVDRAGEQVEVPTKEELNSALESKQDILVSGTNIKTINNESILGSGNIDIEGGSAHWGGITGTLSNQTDLANALNEKQNTLISGTNIKTINNESLLGSGNIDIQGGSSVTIKEINEADLTPALLQEIYNEVPEILRVNSIEAGIQDYELKVNDKSSDFITYTCVIDDTEIELKLQYKDGGITLSTNPLNFMPSNLVNNLYSAQEVDSLLNNKQNTLVSGTNIKTINNESILGEGNIDIQSGGITVPTFDAYFEDPSHPEFEDFRLTQTNLNDIWENKYPLINVRVTFEDEGQTIYYVICFKLSHNVANMAMTYAMTSMEFSNDEGHQNDLDCMAFIIALDDDTNLPTIVVANEEYYTNDYRRLENKPSIPEIDTTIGPDSLDDRVPSSKCVYDAIAESEFVVPTLTPTAFEIDLPTVNIALSSEDCADIIEKEYPIITIAYSDSESNETISLTFARNNSVSGIEKGEPYTNLQYDLIVDDDENVYLISLSFSDNDMKSWSMKINGGAEIEYATDNDIDALFTPVVQMATITFNLTSCHAEINGETISSGHQVPIGQSLEIGIDGDYFEYD